MSLEQLPDFATNDKAEGTSVADQVNRLFALLRKNKITPPPLAIATAYINPGGFSLLADELEKAPQVRLLLGSEPDEDTVQALAPPPAANYAERLERALTTHDDWIKLERDSMGFERVSDKSARRMVGWLRSIASDGLPRVEVRRYSKGFLHGKAYLVEDSASQTAIAGSSNMTYAGLAINAELNLGTGGGTHSAGKVREWFESYWAQSDPYDLADLYADLWEPHTPWIVFLRMLWELYGQHLEEERTPETFGGLTRSQADGVARMQRLLKDLGGVLVADEAGLGKTFLAAEVIRQANEIDRQRVLIIVPAALKKSMWEPFLNEYGFSRLTEVCSYEEVRNRMKPDDPRHTDFAASIDDYAMIVVDEAHNLRNASASRSQAVDQVILAGKHPKKVVLLTATPVNNSLTDLEVLIRYFVRNDARFACVGIPSIHSYIKHAQSIDPENLTPEHLFDLMDQVAVRRTRKFVKEHYLNEQITGPDGQPTMIRFPTPKVRRIDYELSQSGLNLIDQMVYALEPPDNDFGLKATPADPNKLRLARYTPSAYLLSGELESYQVSNAGLLRSALLKRLESSPQALAATLEKLIKAHGTFLATLKQGWVLIGDALRDWGSSESDDLDEFVEALDKEAENQASKALFYDADELATDVESDLALLKRLRMMAAKDIDAGEPKAATLLTELEQIAIESQHVDPDGISHGDRRKVIVFSTYSDTILAVHEEVSKAIETAPASSPAGRLPGAPGSAHYGSLQVGTEPRRVRRCRPRWACCHYRGLRSKNCIPSK
ncbi:MAG: SNF2-related protein [Coriobacteriia bacterium]|nr:SNF2-related protein [Coriobacteriia bacterium]